jgi:hypothetical protein
MPFSRTLEDPASDVPLGLAAAGVVGTWGPLLFLLVAGGVLDLRVGDTVKNACWIVVGIAYLIHMAAAGMAWRRYRRSARLAKETFLVSALSLLALPGAILLFVWMFGQALRASGGFGPA